MVITHYHFTRDNLGLWTLAMYERSPNPHYKSQNTIIQTLVSWPGFFLSLVSLSPVSTGPKVRQHKSKARAKCLENDHKILNHEMHLLEKSFEYSVMF
jgi:hypothetical protein